MVTLAKGVLLAVGLALLAVGLLVAVLSLSPAFLNFANAVAEEGETPNVILFRSIIAAGFGVLMASLGAFSVWRALAKPSPKGRGRDPRRDGGVGG